MHFRFKVKNRDFRALNSHILKTTNAIMSIDPSFFHSFYVDSGFVNNTYLYEHLTNLKAIEICTYSVSH